MRFQVPQFIEVEDKIVGPLTLKQFIYLAGGGGIIVVFFTFIPKYIAFFLSIPVALFVAALAFYKVNNKPFIAIVESFFLYITHPRLYIWKKEERKVQATGVVSKGTSSFMPRLSQSKLKDLTWSLDVKESVNPVTHKTNL